MKEGSLQEGAATKDPVVPHRLCLLFTVSFGFILYLLWVLSYELSGTWDWRMALYLWEVSLAILGTC